MSDDELFEVLDALRETRRSFREFNEGSVDKEADAKTFPLLMATVKYLAGNHDAAPDRAVMVLRSFKRSFDLLSPLLDEKSTPKAKATPAPVAAPAKVSQSWPYPVINLPDRAPTGTFDSDFNAFSALKMFDYTVGQKGRKKGWTDHKRRKFLSDFMEMTLPPQVRKHFGDEYGDPLSAARLRKVANVIAANATNFARRGDAAYDQAITDWEADLAFLKTKYYEGKGLKFQPWPEVER